MTYLFEEMLESDLDAYVVPSLIDTLSPERLMELSEENDDDLDG